MSIDLLLSGNCFWFPSTVMQSVAAIYAIFIAVFLLSIQNNTTKISSITTMLKPTFETVSYIIITVLCFNGLILFSLSYYNLIEPRIKILLICSLISLIVSLFTIVSFSFRILINTAGLKTPKEILIQIEDDENRLKVYTEPKDPDGKYDYYIREQIHRVVHSFTELIEDDTEKLESYMNSERYSDEKLIESYFETLDTHENPFIRARTAKLFGTTKIKKAVELLIRKLDDPYAIVRQYSAEALGEIGDLRAVDPLIQTLLCDDDEYVRRYSVKALCEIKDLRAVDPLIQALHRDDDASVRQDSARALGEIGDLRAVDPLIQTLLHDDNNYARMCSAEALGKIKDLRAVDPLIQALHKDDNASVKQDSAKALGEIGDLRAVDPLIQTLLHDDNNYARICSAEALGKIKDLRAVDPLIQNLNSIDSSVIIYSAKALGRIKNITAVEALIKKLNDYSFAKNDFANNSENTYIRKNLIRILGEIGEVRALDLLIRILNDKSDDCHVRISSGIAIEMIKGENWFSQFLSGRPDIVNQLFSKK